MLSQGFRSTFEHSLHPASKTLPWPDHKASLVLQPGGSSGPPSIACKTTVQALAMQASLLTAVKCLLSALIHAALCPACQASHSCRCGRCPSTSQCGTLQSGQV